MRHRDYAFLGTTQSLCPECHHVLPSGHVIPFCAYNVLYRPGHASLPELTSSVLSELQLAHAGMPDH